MAAPTENYVDPAAGNDFTGTTFADGAYTQSTKTLVKTGAFTANKVGHKLWLTGTGVTPGLFKIATWSDANTVILATDLHPAGDLTDVGCTQHTGSITLPFATVQGCLDLCGQDATNGDRINVKAGTADTLNATLVLTTYGTPTEVAPLIIQGYTSAAGDGGVGEIDGAGSYGMFVGTETYVRIADIKVHNGGAANLIDLGTYGQIFRCEVYNCTGNGIRTGTYTSVCDCNIYEIDTYGIYANSYGCLICRNYIANGTLKMTGAVYMNTGTIFERNIISIDDATHGIVLLSDEAKAIGNTILSAGGTGSGVYFSSATKFNRVVESNYIEGFSGAGGDGVDFVTVSEAGTIYRNNAFYGNEADERNKGTRMLIDSANQLALGASAIAKSGANTFANRFVYFAPLAIIQGDAHPAGANLDIGAVQHADPAAGGGGLGILGGSVVR